MMVAGHAYNRNPTSILKGLSLYEKLFGTMPDYSTLREFGCKTYPCRRSYRHRKLVNKSAPHLFLNYQANNEGYICHEMTTGRKISRDIVFIEEDITIGPTLYPDHDVNTWAYGV